MERLHHSDTLEKVRSRPIQEKERAYATRLVSTPVGEVFLAAADSALVALKWNQGNPTIPRMQNEILDLAEEQIRDYFEKRRRTFNLPLSPSGTPFQMKVWEELLKIPFGGTTSYSAIAEKLGRKSAPRAVGAAIGKNPIGLFIPCHRVIGASGKLVGFAGGIEAKKSLLRIEQDV